jgi:hypothetical protein
MKFSTAALVALSALPLAFAQDSVDECEPPSVHRPGHHQQLSCRNPKDLNPVDVIPITEGFDGKIFTVDVVPRQGSVLVPAPNITTISYPELGFPDYYNDAMPVNVILSTTLVPSRAELSEDGTLAFLEYTLQGLRAWSMELGNIPVEDCFGLGGNPRLEFSNVTRRSLFDDTKDPQNIKWSLEVSEGLEILRPTTQYWEDFIGTFPLFLPHSSRPNLYLPGPPLP